jgi:hypothetical protein
MSEGQRLDAWHLLNPALLPIVIWLPTSIAVAVRDENWTPLVILILVAPVALVVGNSYVRRIRQNRDQAQARRGATHTAGESTTEG